MRIQFRCGRMALGTVGKIAEGFHATWIQALGRAEDCRMVIPFELGVGKATTVSRWTRAAKLKHAQARSIGKARGRAPRRPVVGIEALLLGPASAQHVLFANSHLEASDDNVLGQHVAKKNCLSQKMLLYATSTQARTFRLPPHEGRRQTTPLFFCNLWIFPPIFVKCL
jgi:hypothetical protein